MLQIINKIPKISVILPFYNAEATLERAVSSIADQSFTNFECIMIDNNSSDSSKRIALDFAKKDPRFIYTNEPKQGVVFASNKGSRMAKGEYIARMDADDESYSERLQLQFDFLEINSDYGAVGGLVEYIPHKNNTDGFASFVKWANSIVSYEQIFIKRFMELPIINPSAMWRSEVAIYNGMYKNGDFPEDYQMWLRWLNNGVKIGKVPHKIIKWYDSDQRLTRSSSIYSTESFYKAKSPFLNSYLKHINPHYPKVAVWGASKISRKRAELLTKYGIEICCYIDISTKRQLDKKILFYKDIPKKGDMFILVYVKQSEMRKNVETFLLQKGFTEGENYLFIS